MKNTIHGLTMILTGLCLHLIISVAIAILYTPSDGLLIFLGGILAYIGLIITAHIEDLIY